MTNNQETNERLRPDEVAAAAAFVREQRGSLDGFDIAANVETLNDADEGRQINAAMAKAGATWTLELTPDTLAEHRRAHSARAAPLKVRSRRPLRPVLR